MTSDDGRTVTEADVQAMIRRRAGTASGAPDLVALDAFRHAGFDEEQAAQGARMLESGRYLGFADAATSLATFGYTPRVSQRSIEEAAARHERLSAALREEAGASSKSADPVAEADSVVARAFGRDRAAGGATFVDGRRVH